MQSCISQSASLFALRLLLLTLGVPGLLNIILLVLPLPLVCPEQDRTLRKGNFSFRTFGRVVEPVLLVISLKSKPLIWDFKRQKHDSAAPAGSGSAALQFSISGTKLKQLNSATTLQEIYYFISLTIQEFIYRYHDYETVVTFKKRIMTYLTAALAGSSGSKSSASQSAIFRIQPIGL